MKDLNAFEVLLKFFWTSRNLNVRNYKGKEQSFSAKTLENLQTIRKYQYPC